jgi:hypothetical protein
VIDPDGIEWVSVADAARAVRVRESAIYVWRSRGKVRAHRVGGRIFVCLPDVMAAETEWVRRAAGPEWRDAG